VIYLHIMSSGMMPCPVEGKLRRLSTMVLCAGERPKTESNTGGFQFLTLANLDIAGQTLRKRHTRRNYRLQKLVATNPAYDLHVLRDGVRFRDGIQDAPEVLTLESAHNVLDDAVLSMVEQVLGAQARAIAMVVGASSHLNFETCTLCKLDGATANTRAAAPDEQDLVRRLRWYLRARQGHIPLLEESSRCSRDGQRQDSALGIADVVRQLADELRSRRTV
jgi:hypothetical protein